MRGYNGYNGATPGVNAGMYNGGAVVFNSAPFAQYFLQQQAKKKAESDAQDKYYQDQMKAVTPTGMRAKDIEGGWSKKLQQWQEIGIKNKKALLNPALDGYRTLNEFNRLGNELKSDIERSKQAAELEATIGKAKLEGKFNPSDDDKEIQDDFSRTIYDPNRKGYTLNDLSINRPPFDVTKFISSVTAGRQRSKFVDPANTIYDNKHGTATFTTREEYTPEDIRQIALNAPLVAAQDPAGRAAFQRMYKSEALPQLQEAYSKYFPGIVDTPEKAAAAYAIMNIPKGSITQETKPFTDQDLAFKRKKELVNLQGWWAGQNAKARKATDEKEKISVLNETMDGIINTAKQNPRTLVIRDGKGNVISQEEGGDIPAFGDVGKAAMIPGEKYAPDALRYVKKNGQSYIKPVYYVRKDNVVVLDKNGDPTFDIGASKKLIPLEQYRKQLGRTMFTGKIAHEELSQDYQEPGAAPFD